MTTRLMTLCEVHGQENMCAAGPWQDGEPKSLVEDERYLLQTRRGLAIGGVVNGYLWVIPTEHEGLPIIWHALINPAPKGEEE